MNKLNSAKREEAERQAQETSKIQSEKEQAVGVQAPPRYQASDQGEEEEEEGQDNGDSQEEEEEG